MTFNQQIAFEDLSTAIFAFCKARSISLSDVTIQSSLLTVDGSERLERFFEEFAQVKHDKRAASVAESINRYITSGMEEC